MTKEITFENMKEILAENATMQKMRQLYCIYNSRQYTIHIL